MPDVQWIGKRIRELRCERGLTQGAFAEVLTGSTRLKAGTAQKIVLNTLTTCAMTRTGKVYENMMINLAPSNEKLRRRVVRIVTEILSCDEATAEEKLAENAWSIRRTVERGRGE